MKLIGRAFVLMSLVVIMAGFQNPAAAGKKTGGSVLTAAETAGLIFMREEEKVARDVYLYLFEKWGLYVFDNIATSEQQHIDAILTLLDKYNIADPTPADPGEFNDPELKALYNSMITMGDTLTGAIDAGVAIEEKDIEDLTELIDATTKSDLTQAYTNLRDGSENHLAAFESHLE